MCASGIDAVRSIYQPINCSRTLQCDASVLLADHASILHQVEARRGAQAVQVEYIHHCMMLSCQSLLVPCFDDTFLWHGPSVCWPIMLIA